MLFNSIQFAIFLPIVFLFYWFVFDRFICRSKHQLKLQNAFVVVASYVFYGWWDWRFLLLIAFTSFRQSRDQKKGKDMDVAKYYPQPRHFGPF